MLVAVEESARSTTGAGSRGWLVLAQRTGLASGKTRIFYEEFLGLKVTGISQRVVRFSSTLALREDASAPLSCEGVKLFINVPDVSSCSGRLAKAGVESSKIVVRGKTRSFECRDPAGYAVEVFERLRTRTKN
uniref:hypothetical protein n=1 Tax=Ralstonia chuxiongensis TaxID=2957504 RepID=UPI0037420AF9